ncbi:hypothetical protein [Budvicia aquatica]|uniref:hypothetical protein n=1 Tax=Budvicia aquatica TaxID=82979 RepID=UPI002083F3BF|nr:hypothetical protein [Budvicia aquatica]GKX52731.1 hypothetical protein SOASR029_30400 [Budvicia aquatica]
MDIYWYKNCPNCNQGRLFVFDDITNKRLYLHCEECEMGWISPDDVDRNINKFLTLLEDFEAVEATYNQIRNYGWNKYKFNKIQIDD